MPKHDGLGTDDRKDLQDWWKPAIQLDEEPAIAVCQLDAAGHLAPQNNQLMSERCIFSLKPVCGSGAVVCSSFLLFAAIIAAFRQKLHLSSCADLRIQLWDGLSTYPIDLVSSRCPSPHPSFFPEPRAGHGY